MTFQLPMLATLNRQVLMLLEISISITLQLYLILIEQTEDNIMLFRRSCCPFLEALKELEAQ